MRLFLLLALVALYKASAYVQQANSAVYIMQRTVSAFVAAINRNDANGVRALQTAREASRVSLSSLFAMYQNRAFVMGTSEFKNRNTIRGYVHFQPKTSNSRANFWVKFALVNDATSPTGWKIDVMVHLPGAPSRSMRKGFKKSRKHGKKHRKNKNHRVQY